MQARSSAAATDPLEFPAHSRREIPPAHPSARHAPFLTIWALCALAASAVHAGDDPLRVLSPSLDVRMSPDFPGLVALDLDGLGLGKRGPNVIGKADPAAFGAPVAGGSKTLNMDFTTTVTPISGGVSVAYHHRGEPVGAPPPWTIESDGRGLRLISQWSVASAPGPLPLIIDTRICHASLLGLFLADGRIALPAVLHFPGRGSLRITTTAAMDASLEYLASSKNFIRVTFPSATQATPRIAFDLTVTALHPELPGSGPTAGLTHSAATGSTSSNSIPSFACCLTTSPARPVRYAITCTPTWRPTPRRWRMA